MRKCNSGFKSSPGADKPDELQQSELAQQVLSNDYRRQQAMYSRVSKAGWKYRKSEEAQK